MAKFDGIIGQDVLTVTEGENELTIIFRDNRFLFIKSGEAKEEPIRVLNLITNWYAELERAATEKK